MVSRGKKAGIPIFFLVAFALMAPAANAQEQCGTEYDLAHKVLREAALPRELSRRIEAQLTSGEAQSESVKANSLDRSLSKLDSAADLLGSDAVQVVAPDTVNPVKEAIRAFRDCLKSAPPAQKISIRVAVSRYTSDGGARAVAGAKVRIGGEVAGITGQDGSLLLTVPAGRKLHIAADDGVGFAGAAEVTGAGRGIQQVAVTMSESSVAEPNALTLDEVRADGLLPHDFETLTLRFLDDEKAIAVMTIASVSVESENGFVTSLTSKFIANARGEVVATKPESLRQLLLRSGSTSSIRVMAYDHEGRLFNNAVRFQLGRHHLAGHLVAPSSTPALDLSNIYIELSNVDGVVYRTISGSNGIFSFPYLPSGTFRVEAAGVVNNVNYTAMDRLSIDGDMPDVILSLHGNGPAGAIGQSGNSTGPTHGSKFTVKVNDAPTGSPDYTLSDSSANHCAFNYLPGCVEQDKWTDYFDIPQGSSTVTLRYRVITDETVARQTQTGHPYNDIFGCGLQYPAGSLNGYWLLNPVYDVRYLNESGILTPPGITDWIQETADVTSLTANGPLRVRLGVLAMNRGDDHYQTQITAEVYIAHSCPNPLGGFTTQSAGGCPPTLSIISLTRDGLPTTDYGTGISTSDGNVYSVPRPGRFNHFGRNFSAVIHKTPAEAVLTGDVSLYNAETDELLTTVRTLNNPLTPNPGSTDTYSLPVTFDLPNVSSRVNGVPPPAHFIRYRFHLHAEANEQTADRTVISDPVPIRERALWRMPDMFNNRRFGGGHLNGGEGELGGDNWASRGTYLWMERNQALLTRINDVSGEHGVQLAHTGHGYGTDIDIYHFWPTPVGDDPIGGEVYQSLKADALTAQSVGSTDPAVHQNAVAAMGRLGQWVSASRAGIDNLLPLHEVRQVAYIVDGGEFAAHRRAAAGGGPPPPPSGLLPGWGRDLLRTGRIVFGNGVVADTGLGIWTNGAHAKMNYWDLHHTHVHITLDRCIVDQDGCSPAVAPLSCAQAAVTTSPQSVTISSGQSTTLTVGVTGDGPFSYQWYASPLNSNEESVVLNANSASITVSPTQSTIYRAEMSNNCGDDQSAPAVVTVLPACVSPAVTSSPSDQSIVRGAPATLTVAASGGGPLSYQWFAGLSGDTSTPLPGGSSSQIQITPANTATYWAQVTSSCGTANSASASVLVFDQCIPVAVNTSPASQTISIGDSAILSVVSTGTGPYVFQWFAGQSGDQSQPIPSATSFSIHVSPATTTDYWVLVTNQCGSASSTSATITPVCRPNAAVSGGGNIALGASIDIEAVLTGTAPWSVTWSDGVTQSGITSSPYTRTVTPTVTTTYTVSSISDAHCLGTSSGSATVTLAACVPATISWQPFSSPAAVTSGGSATLSVGVFGTAPAITWFTSSGASAGSGASITVNPTATTSYYATVVNSCGTTQTSQPATVLVCVPGAISSQPVSTPATITPGGSSTLSIGVTGPSTALQWFLGSSGDTSSPIAGATSASFAVTPSVTTSYWARMIDGCGHPSDSNSVIVNVCQPPSAVTVSGGGSIVSGSIVRGQAVTLFASSTGTGLIYQWYVGASGDTSTPIFNGAQSITVTPQNQTSYWVRVTGECGTENGATVLVNVCDVPVITSQPQGTSVFSGNTATLSVAATTTTSSPLTYQWYAGPSGTTTSPVAGATGSSFTTPPLTADTSFWVAVSADICGPTQSSTVTVAICPLAPSMTGATSQSISLGQTVRLTIPPFSPATGNTFFWYQGASGDTSHPLGDFGGDWGPYNYLDVSPAVNTQYWAQIKNGTCIANTTTTTVSVCIPTITQPPAGLMINSGQTTTLTVAANTTGLTYQWYRGTSGDASTPVGTNSSSFTTPALTVTTSYWVRVTGSCGQSVNSSTATVTICQTPAITSQPSGTSLVRGQSTTLTVAASGTNLTYQWYLGASGTTSSPVGGNTNQFTVTSPQNPVDYWVKVTGTCGTAVNSNTAHISVCTTPTVNTQPQSPTIFSGASATLNVSASEATSEAMHYQWHRGTTSPVNVGTDSPAYNTGSLSSATTYYVTVTAGSCSADSAAGTVSICSYPQSVPGAPNANTSPGQTVRLTIPSNPGVTAYLWYRGTSGDTSNPIGGWQAANYLDVAPATTTSYWAQWQANSGSCISNTTTTTVNVCIPAVTQHPASITIPSGSTMLSVVSSLPGSTYQWYIGASGTTTSPLSGATAASVTVSPSATTSYWCRVSGPCGAVNSNAATVTICAQPVITHQPANSASNSGQFNSLYVTATGTNLTYQWYLGASGDTSNPMGATTNTIQGNPTSSIQYWVKVTGTCGSVNSSAAWMSVAPGILQQPQQTTYVSQGSKGNLNVNATGTGLHYQWWSDSGPVSGAPDSPNLITPNITATSSFYCIITSAGGAQTTSWTGTFYLCSGVPIYTTTLTNAGGNCRYLLPNIGGAVDSINWYQGQRGDTSIQAGTGSYLNVCPSTSTTYWFRASNTDANQQVTCYSDSAATTVP